MMPGDEYRRLAANLHSLANKEASPFVKIEWHQLADCYELLAEQAEKNYRIDRSMSPSLAVRGSCEPLR
jgi:hypothetical protein